MARTFKTVVGPVYLPDGSVPVSGRIIFTLSSWDKELTEAVYVPGPLSVPLDSQGNFSCNLFSNSAGENSSVYRVSVVHGTHIETVVETYIATVALSGTGTVKLADLPLVPEWTPNTVDVLAMALAAAASAQASADSVDLGVLTASVAATSADAVQTALDADQVALDADQVALDKAVSEAAADTATDASNAAAVSANNASNSAILAEQSKILAETAASAAAVNADVYSDTTAGLAAVALLGQFQVVQGDYIVRYREDTGPIATEVARFPSGNLVQSVVNKLPPKVPEGHMMREVFDQASMTYAQDYAHRFLRSVGPEIVGLYSSYTHGQVILVQGANAHVDLSCMDSGHTYQFYCNGAGGTPTRFEERQIDDFTASPVFYTASAGSLINITKISTNTGTLYLKDVVSGSYTLDPVQTDTARFGSIILGGQSLAARAMRGATTQSFVYAMNSAGVSSSWRFLNVAKPGSSMFYANDASLDKSNHWWDERTNVPGPLALAARTQINAFLANKPATEPLPTAMMWNIGQNDWNNIEDSGVTTMATVRNHHRSLFSWLRTQCSLPALVVYIEFLGVVDTPVDPYGNPTHQRATMYRRAQLQTCKDDAGVDDPLVRPGSETIDLPYRKGDVHLSLYAQILQGERWADLILDNHLGRTPVENQGCYITSHTVVSNVHRIQIDATSANGFDFPTNLPDLIEMHANVAPNVSSSPLTIASHAWVTTAQPDRIRLDITLATPDNTAKVVLNPGMAVVESGRGNWLRDRKSRRGWRTYDERPF